MHSHHAFAQNGIRAALFKFSSLHHPPAKTNPSACRRSGSGQVRLTPPLRALRGSQRSKGLKARPRTRPLLEASSHRRPRPPLTPPACASADVSVRPSAYARGGPRHPHASSRGTARTATPEWRRVSGYGREASEWSGPEARGAGWQQVDSWAKNAAGQ